MFNKPKKISLSIGSCAKMEPQYCSDPQDDFTSDI